MTYGVQALVIGSFEKWKGLQDAVSSVLEYKPSKKGPDLLR